jgi:hypothetical protein
MTVIEDLLNTIGTLESIARKSLDLLDEYGCESEVAEELHENFKRISEKLSRQGIPFNKMPEIKQQPTEHQLCTDSPL